MTRRTRRGGMYLDLKRWFALTDALGLRTCQRRADALGMKREALSVNEQPGRGNLSRDSVSDRFQSRVLSHPSFTPLDTQGLFVAVGDSE